MKLTKKLLPLVGIGATIASIAPFTMVACNKDRNKTEEVKMVDLDSYTTKFNPIAKIETTNVEDICKAYFGATNAAEIMKDDIYTYLKANVQDANFWAMLAIFFRFEDIGSMGTVNAAEALVSNASIKYTDADKKTGYVSGEIKVHLNADIKEAGKETKIGTYDLTFSYTLKDVPYVLDTGTNAWKAVYLNKTTLQGNENWKIDRIYSAVATYDVGGKYTNGETSSWYQNNIPADIEILGNPTSPLKLIQWGSNYLKNQVKQ